VIDLIESPDSSCLIYNFLKKQKDDSSVDAVSDAEIEDESGSKINFFCTACENHIVAANQRRQVDGKHEHVQANPHGVVFHIGCFSSAPGCIQMGEASSEWSWFKGYNWQICLCSSCGFHLGWLFRSSESTFWGLIMSRLVEKDEVDL